MLEKFLEHEKFVVLMRQHVQSTIRLLLAQNIPFSILANTYKSKFEPELPEEIKSSFKPIISFVLAGYTFESTTIDETKIQFEAGFGPNNIGSVVTIPLDAILQVIVEKTPILINLSIPKEVAINENESGVNKSMEALLSNPKNKNLIKK